MNFEPLEVLIRVITPIVAPLRKQPMPMHLDSLIIGLMTSKEKRIYPADDLHFDDPYAPENAAITRVPLAVTGTTRKIYQCSAAFMDSDHSPIHEDYGFIKKPPGPEIYQLEADNSKRKSKSAVLFKPAGDSAGSKRAWLETVKGIIPGNYIRFTCVGDAASLEECLSDLRRIGYMRRVGLGEVAGINIRPMPSADPSTHGLLTEDDQPARMLPYEDWKEYGEKYNWFLGTSSTRAPYWAPKNRELCWYPPVERLIPPVVQPLRKAEQKTVVEG